MFNYASSCEEAEFEKREDGYRHCSFCGSLHPEDLAKLLNEGKAELHGSDWKYGWPHKFYVDIVDSETGETSYAKFYNNHLGLLDKKTFKKVTPIINKLSGIKFELKEDGLYYKAPHYNYQR